jgi:hypothetical protein
MAFNIAEFQAQIAKKGLAKNNLFYTRITLPNSLSFIEEQVSTRELSFLCQSVSIPSMSIEYTEFQPFGFGKHEKRASDFKAGDLSMIFMVDSKFSTMKFFKRWMQAVVNYNSYDGHNQMDPQGKLPYEFAYKEDYAGTLEVLVFSGSDGNNAFHYKFGNVYPVSMGQMDAAWGNTGDVMTVPVGFAFDKMKMDGVELGQVANGFDRGNGFLTYFSAINGFGQAINQLSKPRDIQDLVNQVTNVNTIFNAL